MFSQNGRAHLYVASQRCAGARPLDPLEKTHPNNMAIFSMRMQVIGRSAGRSATAAAAYRSGEQVADERTGKVHDYTGKSDIYGSEILLPEGAPERLGDRVTLWNEVERVEKRKDAQLSREVMVALPGELTHEQKQALTREYVRGEFTGQGMIADIGYHDFESHNPHAHIMLTMRSVDEDGFGKKRREWNKRQALEGQRKAWEEYTNRALERAGFDQRIDHRSLKEQGVEREPQIHLGAKVMEMEARGVPTRVGEESRRISKVNRDIERKAAQCEKVQAEIEAEQVQIETYILPELFYSGESGIDVKQAVSSQFYEVLFSELNDGRSHQSSVPVAAPELVRRFGELLVRRKKEMILENSLAADELTAVIEEIAATMNELSAATEVVTEKIDEVLAKGDKAQQTSTDKARRQPQLEEGQAMQSSGVAKAILRHIDPRDLARYEAQIAEANKVEKQAEKKQEPVQRQEQVKPRQRKRAKKRDQGMER